VHESGRDGVSTNSGSVEKRKIQWVELELSRLSEIARVHSLFMDNYYTARLGNFYLEKFFWSAVLRTEGTKTFLAVVNDKIVGFVVCTLDTLLLRKNIMDQHFYLGNVILVYRSLFDSLVRLSTLQNMRDLFATQKRILPRAELFLIGVDPRYRNLKIATGLMALMDRYFRNCGVRSVYLRVRRDNLPAIKVYQKFNFILHKEFYEMKEWWYIMIKEYA
jgi:ribosomal protein S18 acetylase RimI-like enzyme